MEKNKENPNQDLEKFQEEYKALTQKYNMDLGAYPVWKLRDDGSYSLFIQFQIQRLKPPVEKPVGGIDK